MEIEFADKRLRHVETAEWFKSGVPADLIDGVRKRIFTIRAAPDERTLRNWKSLHFEKLLGDRKGFWSIRINARVRMVFEILRTTSGKCLRIHAIEDYH